MTIFACWRKTGQIISPHNQREHLLNTVQITNTARTSSLHGPPTPATRSMVCTRMSLWDGLLEIQAVFFRLCRFVYK
ncbi:unnamed protein product [Ixodes pacificus]